MGGVVADKGEESEDLEGESSGSEDLEELEDEDEAELDGQEEETDGMEVDEPAKANGNGAAPSGAKADTVMA